MIDDAKKRELEKDFLSSDLHKHNTAGTELFNLLSQRQEEVKWISDLAWQFLTHAEEKYKAEKEIIKEAFEKLQLLWTDAKLIN